MKGRLLIRCFAFFAIPVASFLFLAFFLLGDRVTLGRALFRLPFTVLRLVALLLTAQFVTRKGLTFTFLPLTDTLWAILFLLIITTVHTFWTLRRFITW